MSTTTGYTDTFGRTVSGGLGTATSGQAYTVINTAADYAVAPSAATITPTTSASDRVGVVELVNGDQDLTGSFSISALPGTNLLFGGLTLQYVDANNYYSAKFAIGPAGSVTARLDKRVTGTNTTMTSLVISGLTIAAGTSYGIRARIRYSRTLQTNVLYAKIWALTGAEPGGWQVVTTDAALTTGTKGGLFARNEATVTGAAVSFTNVSSVSFHLPMPATTDPMCYDPTYPYPKQTALQSVAVAADTTMQSFQADVSRAALFPRVRVSTTSFVIDSTQTFINIPMTTTEFNIGTPTDLTLDNIRIYLPLGVWLVTGEIRLAETTLDFMIFRISNTDALSNNFSYIDMRTNAAQLNDQGVGGTGHVSTIAVTSDPTTPSQCWLFAEPNSATAQYTVVYAALTAIKISDYF